MTRFAVDLDGTLAMAVEATLADLNAEWGSHYTVDDIREWKYWNAFKELQHLPEPKRRDFVLRRMDKVWNEGKVQAYPEAAEFMRELRKYGQVDIVTGRSSGTTDKALEDFFERNEIPYDGIQRTKGSGKVKAMYGYDVYIDDDPNLALEIDAHWANKTIYLVDRYWNSNVPDSSRVAAFSSHGAGIRAGLVGRRIHRIFDLREALPSGDAQQARLFRRVPEVRVRGHRRRA